MLKFGKEGVYVVMLNEWCVVLGFVVEVVDVIGVGDCFGGVFVVWIVVGDDLFVVVCYVNVVVVLLMIGYGVVVLILCCDVVECLM